MSTATDHYNSGSYSYLDYGEFVIGYDVFGNWGHGAAKELGLEKEYIQILKKLAEMTHEMYGDAEQHQIARASIAGYHDAVQSEAEMEADNGPTGV